MLIMFLFLACILSMLSTIEPTDSKNITESRSTYDQIFTTYKFSRQNFEKIRRTLLLLKERALEEME